MGRRPTGRPRGRPPGLPRPQTRSPNRTRDFFYDDELLTRLFEELEPKQRQEALRGAMRKAARQLRRAAVINLRASGLRSNTRLEQGVRAVAFKNSLGMRVTIGLRIKKADRKAYRTMSAEEKKQYKKNNRLLWVPTWAEGGTKERRTRKGVSRGAMPAYRFMDRTLREESEKQEQSMKAAIVEYIEKTAKKYGCR